MTGPRWLLGLGLVAGAPIAAYGWLHRIAPVAVVEWAIVKFSPAENVRAQVAHASMIAGFVAFGLLYAIAAGVMWYLAGWIAALLYLVSLPLTGLYAHHWVRMLHAFAGQLRAARLVMRLPLTSRYLARLRERLIGEIESFRADYRRDVLNVEEARP